MPSPREQSCPDCGEPMVAGWLCGCEHKPDRASSSPAPESCPACYGHGENPHGYEEPCVACHGSDRASSSPVSVDGDDDVLDRAVDAATAGRYGAQDEIDALDCQRRSDIAALAIEAAWPLIVKAERDRLREAIEGLREPEEGFGKKQVRQAFNVGLDSALAVIDEKGDTDA